MIRTWQVVLALIMLNAFTIASSLSDILLIKIPMLITLDNDHEFTSVELFTSRLINTTQYLIDQELASLTWKKGVKYEIQLFSEDQFMKHINSDDDELNSIDSYKYEIRLLHSKDESYYISPFDDNTIYIYQTDYLIGNNLMGEFIKNIILKNLLAYEILDYLKDDLEVGDTTVDEYEQPIRTFLGSVKRSKKLTKSLELTAPVVKLKVTYKVQDLKRFSEFDYETFDELIRRDLIEYLSDYVQIELTLNFEDYSSTEKDTLEHGIFQNGQVIDIDDFFNSLKYDELNLVIYLIEHDRYYLKEKHNLRELAEKVVKTIPQKGGFQTIRIPKNENISLSNSQNIEILETLTGQLLQILGLSSISIYPEPKNPFIRLDFLIRRQAVINYKKLVFEGYFNDVKVDRYCEQIRNLLKKGHFSNALSLSWEALNMY